MKTAVAAFVGVILMSGWVHPASAAASKGPAQPPTLTKNAWREDLRYFAKELPQRHKNLYHATSQEKFASAVAELDAAIPSLQDHQIVVRMQQIAAMVGDGHTGVHVPAYFTRYPIALYWFGRELRVVAAAKEYEAALGKRVAKIGALDIDEVEARVERCFPSATNENEWYVLGTSTAFLTIPEVLHTLGVVPDLGAAAFTLEDDQGSRSVVEIRPAELKIVNGVPVSPMVPASKAEVLYRQRPGEKFWFTYLPESQTVYVSFRGYDSLGENARKLFRFIDANPTQRLVIDMRQNGGGDFFEGRKHLVRPIQERPALNAAGHLFVVIGRRTFSAALANAIDFRKETKAVLVGEPIGERPNSYSENDEMTLPKSKIVVSYSTRYYKFLEEDAPAVLPDKRIDPSWEDYRAGRDPVMEWILSPASK